WADLATADQFDQGIWSEIGGVITLVSRRGYPAPGTPPGANFASFIVPTIAANGDIGFQAVLDTSGGGVTTGNKSGIWTWRLPRVSVGEPTPKLIARAESQAPDTPAGALFGTLYSPVMGASFGHTNVFQNHSFMEFFAQLKTGAGGVDTTNNSGIWSNSS